MYTCIQIIFPQNTFRRYSNIMIFCEDIRDQAYLKLPGVQFQKEDMFLYLKY